MAALSLVNKLVLPKIQTATGEGIGILDFFNGKNILITGATGLLGKVLVEKLLRSTSVGKLYLLIKDKDGDRASHRLTKEIIDADLFKIIREEHGKSYEEFARNKLILVVGNICEQNLGMGKTDVDAIMKDVDIIIESAALTNFNERYDLLLDTNVMGPKRLMDFAKSCKNLKLFTHMSTAYVNLRRQGIMSETIGEYARNESSPPFALPDPDYEISLASQHASTAHNIIKELKSLGQERAAFYGWNNAYQLSKVMGEMTLNENRGNTPLLIIRPSVIESTYKDPFPGWIQGNRMIDPLITLYAKGELPAFLGDPDAYLDLIPVDIVASTTIAAIAKHGISQSVKETVVYNVASSAVNPLTLSVAHELSYESINLKPWIDSKERIPRLKNFENFNSFSIYTRDELSRRAARFLSIGKNLTCDEIQKIHKQCNAKIAFVEHLFKMYQFVSFVSARFDTGNSQKLLQEISKEEKVRFEIDPKSVDWKKYFHEIHIPALRKHVINVKHGQSNL